MKKLVAATVLGAVLAAAPAFAIDMGQMTQGTVQRLDPARRTLTLVGGMTFTIPSNMSVGPLAPGDEVTVTYRDGKEGKRELAGLWVDAGTAGSTRD
jgi:hypothetical protein